MQGRLRDEALSVDIATHCAHCHRSLHLTVDSDLHWHVSEPDARPLLFEPTIDWPQFTAPTIVHDY